MSRTYGRTGASHRRRVTFVTMVVAACLVPIAIAYACNPQAHVAVDKTSYQPGGAITVHGSYFVGNSAVTVSGPTGSVGVTTSPGGGFTTSLTAPASPGSYTISASRPTGGFAVTSFSVAAPAPAAPKPSTPGASAPTGNSDGSPAFTAPGVSKSQAPAAAEQSNPPSSGSGGSTASSGGNVAGSTVTSTPTGQQVFSGSTAQASTGRSFSATAAPAARSSRSAAPAPSAALGDLFANYQPGSTPSLTGAVAGAPAGGAGSGLGLGIGLLGFGLLALVAGLTAAEVRRRRPA